MFDGGRILDSHGRILDSHGRTLDSHGIQGLVYPSHSENPASQDMSSISFNFNFAKKSYYRMYKIKLFDENIDSLLE